MKKAKVHKITRRIMAHREQHSVPTTFKEQLRRHLQDLPQQLDLSSP